MTPSPPPGTEPPASIRPEAEEPKPPQLDSALFATPRLSGRTLRALAMLCVLTAFVARGVAPALPGSMTGIEQWIVASDRAAAFLSQLFVISGCMAGLWLLLAILRDARLGPVFRLWSAPVAAGVITLVLAAARGPIASKWTLGMGFCAAALAGSAAWPALRSATTRASGFVLALAAMAATLQVLARVVAVQASEQALPTVFWIARLLASTALLLDTTALVIVVVWLGASRPGRAAVVAGIVLAVVVLGSWGALRGSQLNASLWQVLAARSLAELTRHPTPLLGPPARFAMELGVLATTAIVLCSRRRGHAIHALIAFALVARGATDIPALALMLTLAALIAPLASVSHDPTWVGPMDTGEPGDQGEEALPHGSPVPNQEPDRTVAEP